MSSTTALPTPAAATTRGPFRLAVSMMVVTTITILQGALTTSTGSGMAFADWPLSDGQLMPERSYTTLPGFFEHFHRLFGAIAGALSLALAAWLQVGHGSIGVRRTAWAALALICVQGYLGGSGVLKNLPAWNSVAHGTIAQLVLATFAWLAYQLSARHRVTRPVTTVARGSGRKLMLVAVAVLVVQTVLGAVARHTNSEPALWTHAGNALVVFITVTVATGFAVGRMREVAGIVGLARSIIGLLMLQVTLGFVALAIRNAAGKTPENIANLGTAVVISVHVLLGALLTVLMATLAAHVFRATRAPDGAVEGHA